MLLFPCWLKSMQAFHILNAPNLSPNTRMKTKLFIPALPYHCNLFPNMLLLGVLNPSQNHPKNNPKHPCPQPSNAWATEPLRRFDPVHPGAMVAIQLPPPILEVEGGRPHNWALERKAQYGEDSVSGLCSKVFKRDYKPLATARSLASGDYGWKLISG